MVCYLMGLRFAWKLTSVLPGILPYRVELPKEWGWRKWLKSWMMPPSLEQPQVWKTVDVFIDQVWISRDGESGREENAPMTDLDPPAVERIEGLVTEVKSFKTQFDVFRFMKRATEMFGSRCFHGAQHAWLDSKGSEQQFDHHQLAFRSPQRV